MDRKSFLSAAGLVAANPFRELQHIATSEEALFKVPAYLKPGDTIGITSPAGYITAAEIAPAISVMRSWGYEIKIGNAIGKRDFTRGGTEEERANDLQQMLDDPSIKAIMCARGGYGSLQIVDKLKWDKFRQRPKWLIGFSDITVLHNHIHANCSVATIHSKMCNSFPDDWSKAEPIQIQTINSIRDALAGRRTEYKANSNTYNRHGQGEGILVGGNLKTIESLAGSSSDINTKGKILFVEDTGEYLYSIDRMFWNLKRTGKLQALQGLIIGGFNIKEDDEGDEFGRTLQEIVLEKVKQFSYPVCFDFPVGHQRANFALKIGVKHKLKVLHTDVNLQEV